MSAGLLTLIVVGLAGVGFLLGWQTSVRATRGDVRRLHSLPKYHGQTVFLFTAVPALLAMALWLLVQPLIMDARVLSGLGEQASNDEAAVALILADVRRVAGGLDALERAGMSADELAQLRAQTTDMRALLGTVGVALGSDVAPVFSGSGAGDGDDLGGWGRMWRRRCLMRQSATGPINT